MKSRVTNILSFKKYKQVLYLLVFLFFTLNGFATDEAKCVEIKNKKAVRLYEQALELLRYNEKETYSILCEVVKLEQNYYEAYYVLANINVRVALETKNPDEEERCNLKARKNFNMVIDLCPSYADFMSYYYMGKFYFDTRNFEIADQLLTIFIQKTCFDNDKFSYAKKMSDDIKAKNDVKNNPVPFNPVPIDGLLTSTDEYLPLITPDGEYMYYTHR